MNLYRNIFKNVLDFAISLIALIVLSPIWIVVSISLTFTTDGHPFFFQLRPGKNGRIFKVIKFKTMNDRKNSRGELLPDEKRLTKVGRFIRKTSLDEIPQLLNVIKGDMSLVGPRPLLIEYLPLYNSEQAARHSLKPGITGWAQVNGRNAITWQQKFDYDIWYVRNMSLLLDLKIMWITVIKVFKSEGINQDNHATADKFTGNDL